MVRVSPRPWPSLRASVSIAIALGLTTAMMLAFRDALDTSHVSLVLLMVVLGASAAGGRVLGLLSAGISFLIFDWFFLPPYNTFVVRNPLDWVALIAFLITSVVAAQLLYRAQEHARRADERTAEVDRLATLGAESLSAARAEDALATVAAHICHAIGADSCEILLWDMGAWRTGTRAGADDAVTPIDPGLATWVADEGTIALETFDGTTALGGTLDQLPRLSTRGVRAMVIPLRMRERTMGVLRLTQSDGLRLDQQRQRVLRALAYYAALGIERIQLGAEASRAEALREADRVKDALLASVSHDLRTPLTTIKALANELREVGGEPAAIIEQEADRLNRFVSDLLDLSRINAKAMPMRIEVNAADDLLGALVSRVEASLGDRRLLIRSEADGALLLGRFDLAQALRALVNLVENAAKHAPAGTAIDLFVRREDGALIFSVADRGPGVEAREVERIFEAFYRAPGVRPEVGGVGLGLSIARGLAEAQDGSVTYAPRPGGGSVFSLRLPATDISDGALDLT